MKKINLSYNDYHTAINEAFGANISNPSVFWNSTDGFYVSPSSDLVPNDDYCVGSASYGANTGGRSMSGSRAEYAPIARGIRRYYHGDKNTDCYGPHSSLSQVIDQEIYDTLPDDQY